MNDTKEEKPLNQYKDIGSWHTGSVIPFGISSLTVRGMITGCGIAQCVGVANIDPDKTKEELLTAFKPLKDDGVGAIVCTLGQNYYTHEPKLLKLGFEFLSEYPNYRHGNDGAYKQRLYILKL